MFRIIRKFSHIFFKKNEIKKLKNELNIIQNQLQEIQQNNIFLVESIKQLMNSKINCANNPLYFSKNCNIYEEMKPINIYENINNEPIYEEMKPINIYENINNEPIYEEMKPININGCFL